jgi:hypothetical protein
MLKVLEQKLSEFKADQNMLGCVGHVINLAAKTALKALDNLKSVDGVKIGKVGYLDHLFKYGFLWAEFLDENKELLVPQNYNYGSIVMQFH